MNSKTMYPAPPAPVRDYGSVLGGRAATEQSYIGETARGHDAERGEDVSSELQVVVNRLAHQTACAGEVENMLLALIARLYGQDLPGKGAVSGVNGRPGLLGQTMGSLDDLDGTLSNCLDALATLRRLV